MGLFKDFWAKDKHEVQPKEIYVKAPVSGQIQTLQSLKDGVFSEELLGKGCVIVPENESITAPFDGVVLMTTASKHAIGLVSVHGVELLIHIGLDTVTMEGDGFQLHVKEGEKIQRGQCLLTFSKEKIKAAGYLYHVILIITNTTQFQTVVCATQQMIKEQDTLISLIK